MPHPYTAPYPPLVLASTSVYRQELLKRLQLPFAICKPDTDETAQDGETPQALALRLALAKAQAVRSQHPDALIIGSDQVANCLGEKLGKPGDHAQATLQLQKMRGQRVVFHTAICLYHAASGKHWLDCVDTEVCMRAYSDAQIENYLRTEQPYDCAGSAKSEALGVCMIQSMTSSDPTALIGLPLIRLVDFLSLAGINLPLRPHAQ